MCGRMRGQNTFFIIIANLCLASFLAHCLKFCLCYCLNIGEILLGLQFLERLQLIKCSKDASLQPKQLPCSHFAEYSVES